MWRDLRNAGIRFPFYGTLGFLTCFSVHLRKPHSKTTKTRLSAVFWSCTLPEIFRNESFRFNQFSRNFVFKKSSIYGALGFFACFSVDPRKLHSKNPKLTSLQYFEVDISGNFQKWKFLFFPIFSKCCFKKISYLWHIGLLDMFLCRSPKTALKNTQNSPLCSILKLTFSEYFKNESFRFHSILKIFFHLMLGFLRLPQKLLCEGVGKSKVLYHLDRAD